MKPPKSKSKSPTRNRGNSTNASAPMGELDGPSATNAYESSGGMYQTKNDEALETNSKQSKNSKNSKLKGVKAISSTS